VIEYAGAIFLVVGFIVILKVSRLVEKSTQVIDISRQAIAILRDAERSDDDKEVAMQSHAKHLAGLFFLITLGGIAAVFAPVTVIWGLDRLGLVSLDGVLSVALSWPFLIATTVLIVIVLFVKRAR
jgi:hypothetical protein